MDNKKKRSKSLFTGILAPRDLAIFITVPLFIDPNLPTNVVLPNTSSLSLVQYNILKSTQMNYTSLLSSKNYPKISADINNYIYLVNGIKEMVNVDLLNPTFQLLINIAREGLIGSFNMSGIYERSLIDELKIIQLNKTISDIMSNKNVIVTISNLKGEFLATKEIKLSSVYSNYIYVYGFPAFGVGFDSIKLAFIRSITP
jgi:hypothetical protein